MSKLIEEVKRASGGTGTNNAARLAVEAVTTAIQKLTQQGEKVTIRGFGTFEEKLRGQRIGRNPRTGESITITARKKLTFKASGN